MPHRAQSALRLLQEGNQRFASNQSRTDALSSEERRAALLENQRPFAVVLGCSDSRVPAEIVFDRGLGDLFVIRVAGNVVAPSQIGSVEYAVTHLQTRLVVVMGHTKCGAVSATLAELRQPSADRSPNLGDIVNRIRPAAATILEAAAGQPEERLLELAVRANVRTAVDRVSRSSRVIEDLVLSDHLLIVGAEYNLETGIVDFFDLPMGL